MGMQTLDFIASPEMAPVLTNVGGLTGQALKRRSHEGADQAKALTLAAEDEARGQRRQARQEADSLREAQRRQRSRSMIALGKSGVTLSGSPRAVLQGRRVEDEQEYRSLLSRGLDRADQTLSRGRVQSAQARAQDRDQNGDRDSGLDWINNGLGLAGSLISNGSLFRAAPRRLS